MDINFQYMIALIYIIIPQMILCIYLIAKYGRNNDNNMGPEIGEKFDLKFLNRSKNLNSKDLSYLEEVGVLLCFISMDCPSCKHIMKFISENFIDQFEKFHIVIEGNKSEVEDWYIKNNYKFHSYFVEKDILFNEMKIHRFPSIFCLEGSVVKKKGPLFEKLINDYVNSIL